MDNQYILSIESAKRLVDSWIRPDINDKPPNKVDFKPLRSSRAGLGSRLEKEKSFSVKQESRALQAIQRRLEKEERRGIVRKHQQDDSHESESDEDELESGRSTVKTKSITRKPFYDSYKVKKRKSKPSM